MHAFPGSLHLRQRETDTFAAIEALAREVLAMRGLTPDEIEAELRATHRDDGLSEEPGGPPDQRG